mgnify:FL=1
MDEIIKKVSAYDLLNSLIPGGALVYFLKLLGYIDISADNAIFLVVLAYILGLVGSRVGSIILEPIAIKCGWVRRDYEGYVKAQKSDERIMPLTTISNMYRSIAGSLIVLALLALGTLVPEAFRCWLLVVYGIACFALFFKSWLKQEGYVARRVEINRKDANDNR